jgi:hypothetical protein
MATKQQTTPLLLLVIVGRVGCGGRKLMTLKNSYTHSTQVPGIGKYHYN